VLQITPQLIGQNNTTLPLSATLNTNTNFTTFIPVAPFVTATDIFAGFGAGGTFPLIAGIVDLSTTNVTGMPITAGRFKSVAQGTATARVNFALYTPVAEPSVSAYVNTIAVGNACIAVPDVAPKAGTTYNCSYNSTINGVTTGNIPFILDDVASPANPMNPTFWAFATDASNNQIFSVTINNGANPSCVSISSPGLGVWTGGLEAYVPFVKTAPGYETYIKLSNRNQFPAKLYVAAISGSKAIPSSIVTSTTSLTVPGVFTADLTQIPTNGQITISGTDLINNNVISAGDAAIGAAVKFQIRVPTQFDPLTGTEAGTIAVSSNTPPAAPGGFSGTYAGTLTAQVNGIADPYITGVVVQVVPGGSQRSINLNFKLTKNGGLVGN
jgi:hypothetical protein